MASTIFKNSDYIKMIVSGLEDAVFAVNPHLDGRFLTSVDVEDASETFKVMKRVRCSIYYHSNKTRKNTPCLTLQEVVRMPKGDEDFIMREFSKRFTAAVFMWTSSQIYKDLIDGKLDCEPPADPIGVS